jgi:hypothetical protein
MHIEILTEDASGELLLQSLLPKILGQQGHPHTWRTHAYKGIGRIPRDLRGTSDPAPRILAGYGKSQQRQDSAVLVVTDLDDRNCAEFRRELNGILSRCDPAPRALFRIAIEEMEAWLLGDRGAILKEFPRAKSAVLGAYVQDSICGTWERLADAVFPGGSAALKAAGWPEIGEQKCKWASQIGRHLDPESNASPSFHALRRGLLKLCGQAEEA